MSISISHPYDRIQPISTVTKVKETSPVEITSAGDNTMFSAVMADEVGKAIPTVPVNALKSVDFSGILDYVTSRHHINAVVPSKMNKMAASFSNKVAFYDACGNARSYDYSSFDQRI